jgi:hypothetical protein
MLVAAQRRPARKCFIGVNIALSAGNAEFRHNLAGRFPCETLPLMLPACCPGAAGDPLI